MKKNVLQFLERHFPERIPPTKKKTRPTRRCVVCYKNNRRKETVFGAPNVKQLYVLKNVSRHFTPSQIFKVRFAWIMRFVIPVVFYNSYVRVCILV